MPRHSRKRVHSKRKKRGGATPPGAAPAPGAWLAPIKRHTDDVVSNAQGLKNHSSALAAQKDAIDGVNRTTSMIASAHQSISALGPGAFDAAKMHLDTAQMHLNAAGTHASKANLDGFNDAMGKAAKSLAQADSSSKAAVLENKTSDQMTIGDHTKALGSKVTDAASDIQNQASDFFKRFNPAATTSGGRRRKSRKHPKKGQKSRTKKGRRRQSKSAKRRSYRSRKGGTFQPQAPSHVLV